MKPEKPLKPRNKDLQELDRLYNKLRGHLNALGLCVRVMRRGSTPREMDEYARHIQETSAQLKQLVAKLRKEKKAPPEDRGSR